MTRDHRIPTNDFQRAKVRGQSTEGWTACKEYNTAGLTQDITNVAVGTQVDTDLLEVIRSSQNLMDEHVRFFMYQLCRAIK